MVEVKVGGAPPEYKIKETAENLSRHINGHRTLVFFAGYGPFRDWTYHVKPIFKQYNPNLGFTYALNQSDEKPYGIRPILSPPPSNNTKQYHELLFETSVKEMDSPSLLGQLVFLLLNTEGTIWTAASHDFYGRVHFPIECEYAKQGIPYSGSTQLLLENNKKIKQFIRHRGLDELDERTKERAERILYDLESFLDERIGKLLVTPPQNNLVRLLV